MTYLIGTILLLICCIAYGLFMGNLVHESKMDWTDMCECGGTDLVDKKYYYVCEDCSAVIRK